MKIIIFTAIALIFSTPIFAASRLCPSNTNESVRCIADAWVAMVPFVSICETQQESFIVMDPGAGRSPMVYEAELSESAQKIIFTAIGENTDNLKLQLIKSNSSKTKGQLSYNSFGTTLVMNFSCKFN
jgi:hypothetical protein